MVRLFNLLFVMLISYGVFGGSGALVKEATTDTKVGGSILLSEL